MNVTVFGATGVIGQLTVGELLDRGHTVTAYARDTSKVPPSWGDRVKVVTGELSNAEAIDSAVAGADAVVSALGPDPGQRGLPLVQGVRNILTAMHRHGVTRYVGHATPAFLDPHERPTLQTTLISVLGHLLQPRGIEQMFGVISLVTTADDVRWTLVRFTAPRNGPAKGNVRVGFYGTDKIGFPVTRADIAAFTAAQIDDDTYIGRAPAISN